MYVSLHAKRLSFLSSFIQTIVIGLGPGDSVGKATDFRLEGPGSNIGGDEIFRLSKLALGLTQPPVKSVPGLSSG